MVTARIQAEVAQPIEATMEAVYFVRGTMHLINNADDNRMEGITEYELYTVLNVIESMLYRIGVSIDIEEGSDDFAYLFRGRRPHRPVPGL